MTDRAHYPVRDSRYFTPALYEGLIADAGRWDRRTDAGDSRDRATAEAFLYREARLLDQGRFDEWLDLYCVDCVYWIPAVPGGGDPRREVSIALDDRRRLEDRVVWLRSAFVWSQIPRSRTTRLITNVEAIRDGSDLVVRSSFALYDIRGSHCNTHVGWYLHRIDITDGRWRIRIKQIHLADSDQAHENMSIIL